MKLTNFIEIYLEQKSKTWRPPTYKTVASTLKKIISEDFESIEDIKQKIHLTYTNQRSRITYTNVIKNFLEAYNKKMNEYVFDFEVLTIKGEATKTKEVITDEQMLLLRAEAKNSKNFEIYLMTEFLYVNLPRIEEAFQLLKENNFEWNSKYEYFEVFKHASKNNKERQYIIPKELTEEYKKRLKKWNFKLSKHKYFRWINEASQKVNKVLNIETNEKITSHSFRTYWITKWLDNGESTFNIMLKTGHTNDRVLLDTYYRGNKEKIRENNLYLEKSILANRAKKATTEHIIELEKTIYKLQLENNNQLKTINNLTETISKLINKNGME